MSKSNLREVSKKIIVDLEEVIEVSGLDCWCEYICDLIGEPLLQDIQWTIVSGEKSSITLEISGYVDETDDF